MRRLLVLVVTAVVFVAGCGSSSKKSGSSTTTVVASPLANDPVYAKPGPYKVGYTTLKLPDRTVYVWYPTDETAVARKKKATYDQTAPLPENLKGILPAKFNTVITMDAYAD